MLGQLMGDAGDGVGEGLDEDLDAPAPAKNGKPIDPAELVNPMFVDGVPSACFTPTILWSVQPESVASNPPSIGWNPDAPSSTEIADLPQPSAEQPQTEKDLGPALADLAKQLTKDAAPEAASAPVAETPSAPAETPVPNIQAGKTERNGRGSRHEKTQAETRIDAVATRSVPAIAIERAYTSNDRESSKSFDSKPESAPTPRLQSIGQPVATTAFVVPMEARAALNAPAPAMTLAAPAPVLDPAIEAHVPQQIVQSIRMQAIDGGGEAVLRLRPEYLGDVVVAVKVEQGSVTAALQSDTPAVRQWVERNESMLRQGLAEHGLQLERLTVTEKAAETENEASPDREKQSHEEPSHQQSRRRRAQTDEATFEVTA